MAPRIDTSKLSESELAYLLKRRASSRLAKLKRLATPEGRAHERQYQIDNREKYLEAKRKSRRDWYKRIKAEGGAAWERYKDQAKAHWRKKYGSDAIKKLGVSLNIKAAPGEEFIKALNSNKLYASISSVVSRALPAHIREDVISSIVIDVLEGKIDIKRMNTAMTKPYVTACYREFNRCLSLNEELFEGTSYIDLVPDTDLNPEESLMERELLLEE